MLRSVHISLSPNKWAQCWKVLFKMVDSKYCRCIVKWIMISTYRQWQLNIKCSDQLWLRLQLKSIELHRITQLEIVGQFSLRHCHYMINIIIIIVINNIININNNNNLFNTPIEAVNQTINQKVKLWITKVIQCDQTNSIYIDKFDSIYIDVRAALTLILVGLIFLWTPQFSSRPTRSLNLW